MIEMTVGLYPSRSRDANNAMWLHFLWLFRVGLKLSFHKYAAEFGIICIIFIMLTYPLTFVISLVC